jgi:flagellar hook-associated protein 3
MSIRITNSIMTSRLLYNIMNNMNALDSSQQKLSTGKKYTLPEQDPIGNVISMGYRTHISEIDQYVRNIDDGTTVMNTAEESLSHANDLLQRVRTLTIQGANSHLNSVDRDALAREVDQIINGLVDVGNTEFRGEYIFSGHETTTPPFGFSKGKESGQSSDVLSYDWEGGVPDRDGVLKDSITEVQYNGDTGKMDRQIEKSLYLSVNETGNEVFSAQDHEITGGVLAVSKSTLPINNASNFNGAVNSDTSGIGTFSIGLSGGKIVPISYDASKHSLEDIRDMINKDVPDVKASIEKTADSNNNPFYRLKLESKVPGREIVITDDDQSTVKQSSAALPAINTGNSFATAGFPTTPTGMVIINGEKFELSDYATVDSFTNAVKNDPKAGVADFYYDSSSSNFVIKAKDGYSLELEENGGPAPANSGFFTAVGIKTNGDLMEKLGMRNRTHGTLEVDRTAALSTIPGIQDGSITVNGKEIKFDISVDSLQDVVKKINDADVGVKAYTIEYPVNSGSGNYRLELRSTKPGEIKISDRNSNVFSTLGVIDKFDNKKTDYPANITSPRDISVFDTVMKIRNHLFNGDLDSLNGDDIKNLDKAIDQMQQVRAKIGARINTMTTAQSNLKDVKLHTTNLLSNVEDVDIAEVIMKMQLQQNTHQAALSVGSKVITTSLVDFLR